MILKGTFLWHHRSKGIPLLSGTQFAY